MFGKSLRRMAAWAAIAMGMSCAVHAADDGLASPITITDNRSPDQMAARRDSIFSAIAFLPDKAVNPSPVDQLQAALRSHDAAAKPLQLSITEFRVIDFFPRRLKSGPGGRGSILMDALADSKTDWAFVKDMQVPQDQDAVVCLLIGTLNGQEVKAYASMPYHTSAFAITIHSDKNFKAAVTSSIDQVAQKILANTQMAQASP